MIECIKVADVEQKCCYESERTVQPFVSGTMISDCTLGRYEM